MTRPTLYWEDLKDAAETVIGSFTLSEAEIIEFARRYDPQVFHTDPQAALATSFGGLCASGMHTASMVVRTLVDGYLHESANLGSPGFDEMRFHKPVRPGDTLTVRRTVLEARPTSKGDRGIVRALIVVDDQRGERVFSMQLVNLFARRPK